MSIESVDSIGYVVALEGTKIRVNLLEGHKGQLASHRRGVSSVSQPGDLIGLDAGTNLVIARITDMAFVDPDKAHSSNVGTMNVTDTPLRQLIAYSVGYVFQEGDTRKFISENWKLPTLGAKAIPLSSDYLETIYGVNEDEKDSTIELGRDSRTKTTRINAGLNSLLSRHLAVLGSTGYGKSNFNALLSQRIREKFTKSRIVIFDINGEYADAFIGQKRVKETILGSIPPSTTSSVIFEPVQAPPIFVGKYPTYHQIPYQAFGYAGLIKLLRPSDKTQLPALRNALKSLHMVCTCQNGLIWTAETIPPSTTANWFELVDDCRQDGQDHLSQWLKKLRSNALGHFQTWPPFKALANLVAEFGCQAFTPQGASKRDAFSYGNVLPLVKIIQQLVDDPRFNNVVNLSGGQAISNPATMWNKEVEDEVDYIFGKKSGGQQDWDVHIINLKNIADDHAPMILGSLLEMYSDVLFKRGQDQNYPTMLLLEEAHHYLRDPFAEEGTQLKAYERLAKEGRKFNCSLLVSTQRPSELSSTVLAMCSNWISLRLTNERDINALRHAIENGNEHTLSEISGLPRGDAIGFGSAFNIPIRFSIDEAKPKPKSSDAAFASIWS
ncbi:MULTISPECIES: anti-phage-associated helicase HerA [Shewanella]|uniref:anti-phage-associated helicase HerA n=1 Tax=Shewanella TaxID=22 RepID=UPI00217E486C|nr:MULTISPECIES: anti-phage-associated helicase HerA [Shewanella]MCS6159819.1 ATP-binding protein [Shewanella baltica]MCS6207341.1 ATP-binding protein [Shewanella baltica]MCU7976519.1 ATP-binding protein [Shewanella sp. SW36]MCU7991759.1 ATP-binding protein [Shewanella sp. SW1]MCU8053139.1 ATP-binding protein [Shewanella sp. SM43]